MLMGVSVASRPIRSGRSADQAPAAAGASSSAGAPRTSAPAGNVGGFSTGIGGAPPVIGEFLDWVSQPFKAQQDKERQAAAQANVARVIDKPRK